MKVYNGWVLKIGNMEQTVIGSVTIRRQTSYILKNVHGNKSSIKREVLLAGMHDGSIKYVAAVSL